MEECRNPERCCCNCFSWKWTVARWNYRIEHPIQIIYFLPSEQFLINSKIDWHVQCQAKPNKPLTTSSHEILRFTGITLWMSLIWQPNPLWHWCPKTCVPQITDVMSLNQFEKLKHFLHFSYNANNTKKNDKIMSVLDEIRSASLFLPLEGNVMWQTDNPIQRQNKSQDLRSQKTT